MTLARDFVDQFIDRPKGYLFLSKGTISILVTHINFHVLDNTRCCSHDHHVTDSGRSYLSITLRTKNDPWSPQVWKTKTPFVTIPSIMTKPCHGIALLVKSQYVLPNTYPYSRFDKLFVLWLAKHNHHFGKYASVHVSLLSHNRYTYHISILIVTRDVFEI